MRSRAKTPAGFLRLRHARSAEAGAGVRHLRERLTAYGVRPRKRWGQNFLVRPELAERIVDACLLTPQQVVVEIGPGAGALTGLLAAAAGRVMAVERDPRLAALLRDELGDWGKVEIVEADFLELDLGALARRAAAKLVVVGNLPYSITTPILTRLIEERAAIETAVVLVQREYAARLAAAAGTPDYGALTVYARFHVTLEALFPVAAGAFWPKPEVESMLVRVRFRARPPVEVPEEERFFALVRAAFGQRRKTLANALAAAYGGDRELAARTLKAAAISGARRGETLEIDEFAHLARADARVRASG